MTKAERAEQARRELDRKFEDTMLEAIRVRPRTGWIHAIRGALGMSQADLARKLGITAEAVNKLEHAEVPGGITINKLSQVARALDCTLVYALVPNTSLEQTVLTQARIEASSVLGYTARTMALEDQAIDNDRHLAAIDRFAREIVNSGRQWKTSRTQKSQLP